MASVKTMKMLYCEIKVHMVFPFLQQSSQGTWLDTVSGGCQDSCSAGLLHGSLLISSCTYCVCHYVINFSGLFSVGFGTAAHNHMCGPFLSKVSTRLELKLAACIVSVLSLTCSLTFATEEGFSYHQTSSFLTLLHTLLLNCRGMQARACPWGMLCM